MRIGIIGEHTTDAEIFQILTAKVLADRNEPLSFAPPLQTSGSVAEEELCTKVRLLFNFFECDVVVFATDRDTERRKRQRVIDWLNKCPANCIPDKERIVIAIPDTEIEQWFLSEKDATTGILGLSTKEFDSVPQMNPKERINRAIEIARKKRPDDLIDLPDHVIKRVVAEKMSVDVLAGRDQSFRKFRDDARQVRNYVLR